MLTRYRTVEYGLNFAAGACIFAAIGLNSIGWKNWRVFSLVLGIPAAALSGVYSQKADVLDPFLKIDKQTELEMHASRRARDIENFENSNENQTMALPQSNQPPVFFDWSLIQSNPDKYAHLAIVGGTGDGKTTLVRSLLQFLGEKAVAIDPHWQPGNYPGIPTVAKGRNYGEYPATPIPFSDLVTGKVNCSYAEAIATIHKEMDDRYKLLAEGKPVGERFTFILDEYTTFAGSNPKCSAGEVLDLIREARKVGLRLILIVQSDLLEDFKWQGQGAARKSLRWCRLGEFAAEFAKAIKDKYLINQVANEKYPILLEKTPAILPVPFDKLAAPAPAPEVREFQKCAPAAPESAEAVFFDIHETQPMQEEVRTFYSEAAKEKFPASFLPLHQLKSTVHNLKNNGQNQAEIIKALWGVSKGGSTAYKIAVKELKELIK